MSSTTRHVATSPHHLPSHHHTATPSGNVWQYTDSEYSDTHTRFVLLRGGSLYQPRAASDFQNWYFGSSDEKARPGGAVRNDRHAKYFLMSASYERVSRASLQPRPWHTPLQTPRSAAAEPRPLQTSRSRRPHTRRS